MITLHRCRYDVILAPNARWESWDVHTCTLYELIWCNADYCLNTTLGQHWINVNSTLLQHHLAEGAKCGQTAKAQINMCIGAYFNSSLNTNGIENENWQLLAQSMLWKVRKELHVHVRLVYNRWRHYDTIIISLWRFAHIFSQITYHTFFKT